MITRGILEEDSPSAQRRVPHLDNDVLGVLNVRNRALFDRNLVWLLEDHRLHSTSACHGDFCSYSDRVGCNCLVNGMSGLSVHPDNLWVPASAREIRRLQAGGSKNQYLQSGMTMMDPDV